MEAEIQRLAAQTWAKFQTLDSSKRYLIAVSGIPGSGKTTVAALMASALNTLYQESWHKQHPHAADYRPGSPDPSCPDIAKAISLDGFHLTRAQLSAMPDPKEAHYRRGAAFTFDPAAYLKLIQQLRQPLEAGTRTIYAPSFDHAVKDPVADDIKIPPTARILLIEGLYVALDREGGWREAAELMDEIWFVEVPVEIATERVAKRNFAAGLSPSYDEAVKRTINNDMRNGKDVLDSRMPVTEVIDSVEDEEWKSKEQKRVEAEGGSQVNEPISRKVERLNSIAEMAEAGVGM